MHNLPLFPVTTVGSWPRSKALISAQRAKQAGRISESEFTVLANADVVACLKTQEEIGVDIVTDGELRRDNFYSFVTEKLSGTKLMTLGEMMEYVEDRASFEELLQRLDVPASAIKNPTAVARISQSKSLVLDEFEFAKRHTTKPIKVTLPGPYLLSRAMWVPEISGAVYDSKEALAADVVALLIDEVNDLANAGAAFIQFDEPILTELVFTQGKTRTFMCAALAARNDPAEELEWAVSLINRVAKGLQGRVRTGVHVCRGNWSRDEATLLSGSYGALKPWLDQLIVDQLVLEYATSRAGEIVDMGTFEIGLGVVNPRTSEVETVEAISLRIEQALQFWRPDQIFLNPDCGFATFSEREMNSTAVATEKMTNIVCAAKDLRALHSR